MLNIRNAYLVVSHKSVVRLTHLTVCLALIASSLIHFTQAQQSSFNKANRSQNSEFTYKWRHQDNEYQLNFAIDTATLYEMPPSPPNYMQKVFQDKVYLKVMFVASEIDSTLANIDIKKNHTGLSFNVSSRHPEQAQLILDQLKVAHNKAQEDYWSDNFFVKYNSPTGADGIRHDHAKYTSLSSRSLTPIVEAIKKQQSNPKDMREFIQISLGWIQSIPYNRLEDRLSSNGAGFVSPRDLLIQNQGDCDSKSTLMAALLKAYNQNLDVQMVYLPEHALLAVKMRAQPDEMTLKYKGDEYVLLEPTGPAQLSIGKVADTTKISLKNRRFELASL
jgi:hypothetical protein